MRSPRLTPVPRRLGRRAAVLARSYGRYREWCAEHRVMPGRDAYYVARPAELAGWVGPVVKVDGWDAHRSAAELAVWRRAEAVAAERSTDA